MLKLDTIIVAVALLALVIASMAYTGRLDWLMATGSERFVAIGTLAFTAIIAFASWRAAAASRQSAEAAKKSSEAQLLSQFLNEYASEEMREALRWLRDVEVKKPEVLSLSPEIIQTRPTLWQIADSEQRRRVHYYFKRAYRLHEHGFLSVRSLELIIDSNGYRLLFDVVKPLSLAVNPLDSDLSRFDGRILGQEAEARMHGLGAGLFAGGDDIVDDQVPR